MLERLLTVGAPSPLPAPREVHGAGAECNLEVVDARLGAVEYWDLPFAVNGINYVASQGRDVLSGHFTGCRMASYKVDGQTRVCHVSTGANQDCLPQWDALKATAVNIFEFIPSDFIETNGAALAYCYGLITATLETYAITVVHNADLRAHPKIAAVARAHLLR